MGMGAVGGYFGGRLAAAGEDVVFVARGHQVAAARSCGLRIDSSAGTLRIPTVRATDTSAEVGTAEIVLVAVKAWQLGDAADAIRPMVGERTVILPLQNGVEAAPQLAALFGRKHVVGGLCRILCTEVAPGRINHAAVAPYVAVGELDNSRSTRLDEIVRRLENAGVDAEIPPDIHVAIWEKFLLVAPVSGVCALARVPLGRARAIPETRRLLELAMNEVFRVGRAREINLSQDSTKRTMELVDNLPEATMTSMQRALMEERPSELEAHSGAVVHMGRAVGVATPVNEVIYGSLLPRERLARASELTM